MNLKNKLKDYKFIHWIYNLLHTKQLQHNKAAYKKYNLHKPLFDSISSKDFPDKTSSAWLDLNDSATAVAQKKHSAILQTMFRNSYCNGAAKGFCN